MIVFRFLERSEDLISPFQQLSPQVFLSLEPDTKNEPGALPLPNERTVLHISDEVAANV